MQTWWGYRDNGATKLVGRGSRITRDGERRLGLGGTGTRASPIDVPSRFSTFAMIPDRFEFCEIGIVSKVVTWHTQRRGSARWSAKHNFWFSGIEGFVRAVRSFGSLAPPSLCAPFAVSPVRSTQLPWPRVAIALCWWCHGRATWNLSSPILSQVIQDDDFVCSRICLNDSTSFGAGKEYETTRDRPL
jgi:hypothetical protein